MQRPLLVILLASALAAAADDVSTTISFRLPDASGNHVEVADLGARYALLVYQGIP